MLIVLSVLFAFNFLNAEKVVRKQFLPLCENIPVKSFMLRDPGPCMSENATKTIYPIDVYKPIDDTINVKATACRIKMEIHKCSCSILFAKNCILAKVIYKPVDIETCKRAEQNRVTEQGILYPEDDRTLSTRNILKPIFNWWRTNTIKNENFVLAYISIKKDLLTEQFNHVTLGNLQCDSVKKTCSSDNWSIYYDEINVKSCHNIPKKTNTSLILHTTANGIIYQVKGTNLISTVLTKCEDRAIKCISKKKGEKLLCTLSNYVLKVKENANVSLTNASAFMNTSAKYKQIYAAITTVANANLLNIQLLQRVFENALCENARASLISLMGSQKLNPSETLSFLLNEKVNAVYSSGVLKMLKCSMVEAYLQPTLKHNGRISDRPLFKVYVGLGAITASLRQGRFLTRRITNTVFTTTKKSFEFGENVLLFENETLINELPSIHRITIKNLKLNEKLLSVDEEEMATDFERIANSEEDNTRQQLKNLIYLTKKRYEANGIDIEPYLVEGQKFDSSFFTDIFKSVSNGIWGKTENVLDILTKAYTIGITLILLIVMIQTIRECISKACRNERMVQPET